jgi:hypothetical protein
MVAKWKERERDRPLAILCSGCHCLWHSLILWSPPYTLFFWTCSQPSLCFCPHPGICASVWIGANRSRLAHRRKLSFLCCNSVLPHRRQTCCVSTPCTQYPYLYGSDCCLLLFLPMAATWRLEVRVTLGKHLPQVATFWASTCPSPKKAGLSFIQYLAKWPLRGGLQCDPWYSNFIF